MLRWTRSLIVVFVALALSVGASGVGWGGTPMLKGVAVGVHHHNCEEMAAGMSMDDCMRRDVAGGGATTGCPSVGCAAAPLFLLPQGNSISPMFARRVLSWLPNDERAVSGFSGPPDLRPPIA